MANSKNKVRLGILIVSVFVLITSVSYALWQMILQQESTNVVNTACFKINFKDENEIHLQSAYPISDAEGMSLTPYTFTIENICNTNATYQINLEELTTELKKLSKEYIKVSLNNAKAKLLNTYETVEKTLSNAESSKKLTTGVLKAGDSKTFDLRLWLDENTPAISDAMNATFQSKVTIIAMQKEGLPEVEVVAQEKLDGITVDISTVENPKNETLTYFYQLNGGSEIESEENTHTFTGLSDGKYKAKGRAETLDGIILEEKELDVTVAYEQVYVSASGNDETGNGSLDNPFVTLQPAYNKVKSGGEILLLSDITATSTTNMNIENKGVTLRSNGENVYTILKDSSFTTQILDITNSNTVTTTNVVFDGNEVISSGALIEAHDSTLNLSVGTTVQKNNNHGRYYEEGNNNFGALGGGLAVWQGTLNINDANIINNKTSDQKGSWSHGAGIYISNGTINFNSGNISYNEAIGNVHSMAGGGLCLMDTDFNMNGGTISNNYGKSGGGGIFFSVNEKNSTFIMNDGTIFSNQTDGHGGGIYAHRPYGSTIEAIVYLKKGEIINNINGSGYNGPNLFSIDGAQIIDQRT